VGSPSVIFLFARTCVESVFLSLYYYSIVRSADGCKGSTLEVWCLICQAGRGFRIRESSYSEKRALSFFSVGELSTYKSTFTTAVYCVYTSRQVESTAISSADEQS
jgi:hypothetical protein